MPLKTIHRWLTRWSDAPGAIREQPDRLVTVLYRLLLDREPDADGRGHYVRALADGRHTWDTVLRELLASEEYQARMTSGIGAADVSQIEPSLRGYAVGTGARFAEIARARPIEPSRFDAAWRQHVVGSGRPLVIEQAEYLEEHRTRFYELVNAMTVLLGGRAAPLVLEIGVSEASALYKALWPSMRLVTLDRPPPPGRPGFTESICRRIANPERHYTIDLEKERLHADYGNPPLGRFDLVLCTEVIEHLLVHPLELLAELHDLLQPDGCLYLSTPNFFSYDHLERIRRRQNPQPLPPRRGQNWNAHYHVREYCMSELVALVEEAGGEILAAYYSDCWDGPERASYLARHPDQRSDLVVISHPVRFPGAAGSRIHTGDRLDTAAQP